MPKGSRLVAVDQPNGPWGRTDSQISLTECVGELKRIGHDAHLFFGDSTSAKVIDEVRGLAPFDVMFIDANHTAPFVRKDFASYGQLARYCCFHDIGWNNPTPPGRMAIDVPEGLGRNQIDPCAAGELCRNPARSRAQWDRNSQME